MALIDEFNGDDIDLAGVPGFESLYEQSDELDQLLPAHDADAPEESEDPPEGDAAAKVEAPERGVSRKEFETLQSQNAELIAMLKEQNARPPAPIYVNAPQPQATQEQMTAQREALQQQFYSDPVGTAQRISAATAQSTLGNDLSAMRETLAQQTVQNYRMQQLADPTFKAAAKYFDEQLAQVPSGALARLTPFQLTEFLTVARKAALGTVYEQVVEKQRKLAPQRNAQQPPAYGGSGRGGGGSPRPVSKDAFGGTDPRLVKALGLTQADFDDSDN